MIRIFQMRDLGKIEAFVLAEDYDRAHAMFERHLRAHGGDPDAVIYRQVRLEHIEDERTNDTVNYALDLGSEGLVTCDAHGRWSFVTPLGGRNHEDG